jgi:hypothetical protein
MLLNDDKESRDILLNLYGCIELSTGGFALAVVVLLKSTSLVLKRLLRALGVIL